MSYVKDPVDNMYYWVEDGKGNINNIPLEAVGKIKNNSNANMDTAELLKLGLQGIANSADSTVSSQDFDVYWTSQQYGGGKGGTATAPRSFSSIEKEFKNYSIKDPEYLKWVNALRKTQFGQNFPKKKTPTKGQVLSALRAAAQESSVTGTALQDLVYNNQEYKTTGTGSGLTAKQLSNYKDTISARAISIGVELTDKQLKQLASEYAQGGMSADVLDNRIAQYGKVDFSKGSTATTVSTLKQWAADNGVSFDDGWYQTATNNIITGKSTLETEKQTINNFAKSLYAAEPLVKGIDAGFSVRQQASPYINYLAKIRGVDPSSISLDDPFLKKTLTKRDDKGNPTMASYYDFMLDVRQNDPEWAKSPEAEQEVTSMLNVFGRMFGKSV